MIDIQAESKKLEGEITELSKNIVSRNDSLQKQARSAQNKMGAATNYIKYNCELKINYRSYFTVLLQ